MTKMEINNKFKIGDWVFWIDEDSELGPDCPCCGHSTWVKTREIFSSRIERIEIHDNEGKKITYSGLSERELFATREEAEAKLKELENGKI